MTSISSKNRRPREAFWLAAITALILSALVSSVWIIQRHAAAEREQRQQATNLAANHARLLETNLRHSLTAALTLATYVRNNPNISDRFESVALDVLQFYPDISALSLSPDGVISTVVPLEGNEAALGFDQLSDSDHGSASRLAPRSQSLSVVGPMDLVQGGQGVVGRYPVFVTEASAGADQRQFWGFTNVTIELQRLLDVAQLAALPPQGYAYRLTRSRPDAGSTQVIAASTEQPLSDPIRHTIAIPNNPWVLSMAPEAGWHSGNWLAAAIGMAVAFSLMLGYLVKTLLELRWHKGHLEQEVEERTRAVTTNLERYRSLITASNTGAWEYFHSQGYLKCSPEYFSMLGYRPEDFNGDDRVSLEKAWIQLVHPEDRAQATAHFQSYIDSGAEGMYENRFRMQHKAGFWVWILSRGQSLRGDQGQLRGVTVGTHIDISQQIKNESKLALAAKVFERGSEGFLITDADQKIVMVNNAFTRITGYPEPEALGQHPRILASGRHDEEFYRNMWQSLEQDGLWQGEIWNRRKNGDLYPQWLSISLIANPSGQVTHYIGIISDISRLKEDQEAIHQLAYYDPLTHLPNRTLLEERAAFALKLAQRNEKPLALLFLDLDNFKNINDSLGHQAGDRLLVAFAQRIAAIVRDEDTFARPGGDEFILMLPETDASGAAHAAEKILTLLTRPFLIDGYDLSISSSIGIALYPGDGEALNPLYTNADIAMYRAKQKGRNTYSFFTPELQSHYVRLMQLENAMRQALEENQFQLHYQPQLEVRSGETIGFEALLRWHHPTLGRISPAEFIPVAESSGLIIPIGEWVLREATQQCRRWIDSGIAPPKLAVNLSAAQFRQPALPDLILTLLEEAQLPADYLELELTESITMDDPERAITIINRLHSAGVTLSIDDFGTGYSSLSYLKRFKISKLKIDQSFVRDLMADADDRVIVSTIITLTKSLGMRCVAEGVETPGQLDFLRALGCEDIQGYYFSHPLNAKDTEVFLRGTDMPIRPKHNGDARPSTAPS